MKGLKDVLAKVEALKKDLEDLGAEVKVSVSIEIPLKNLEAVEG